MRPGIKKMAAVFLTAALAFTSPISALRAENSHQDPERVKYTEEAEVSVNKTVSDTDTAEKKETEKTISNEKSASIDSDESDSTIAENEGTQCGEYLYYTYDSDTKTFKITGYGDMWDFDNSTMGEKTICARYYVSGYTYKNGGTGSKYYYDDHGFQFWDGSYGWYYRSPWSNGLEISTLDMSGCPNMTRIGKSAFLTKEYLTSGVEIPTNVKSIGEQAFEDTGITSLKLNDRLKEIGYCAFHNCKSLMGNLIIPENVTSIGTCAFEGDSKLTGGLTLPKSISELGYAAFRGDTGLNGQLIFESGINLEEIPGDAFRGCSFTGRVNVPQSVKKIGDSAFYSCPSINEVYIPAEIESIEENAFDLCPNINKVIYGGTTGQWYSNGLDKVKGLNEDYIEMEFQGGDIVNVTFDSMGGTPVESMKVSYNSIISKPADPEKPRCEFRGWYTGPNFSGEKWDFTKDTIKNDTVLYAAWYQTDCLVSFNSMGGTPVESQIVEYGDKVGEPDTPVRGNLEFLGWYTDRSFSTQWDFNDAVYSDITLYAKWSGMDYDPSTNYYVINSVAGYGGSISPEDSVFVSEGNDQTFTITPNNGFRIKSVSVDDIDVGNENTYTFVNVRGDHKIAAYFESTGGEDIGDDGKLFYTVNASADEGGYISPEGSVIVPKYENITFSIISNDGNRISNVLVDGKGIGAVSEKTFNKVMSDHTIEAKFIEDSVKKYYKVTFVAAGAEENVADMYLAPGSKIPKTMDPVKSGYIFKGWFKDERYTDIWDFDNDRISSTVSKSKNEMKLYACFIPVDKSRSELCIRSSTEKHGMWIETVIGQGCKQKLYLANADGKIMDKKSVKPTWKIKPYGNIDTGLEIDKYFNTKKLEKSGVLQCKKQAPKGFKAMVYTTYNGTTVHYIVTVVERVKKMGYTDANGKFHKSIVITPSDNRCDFGYGPQHFIGEDGKYIEIFNKNRVKIGTALYEQPDESYWTGNGKTDGEVYLCSARIPGYAGVVTRMEKDPETKANKKLYYFDAYYTDKIKNYKIEYISPDGSGKKFTVIFKKSM